MTREITATVAGDRGMRSHRPSARHDIPCERRYSGRCEEVATEPACLVMQFVQGETFHARLERGPLPQHDEIQRISGRLRLAHRRQARRTGAR